MAQLAVIAHKHMNSMMSKMPPPPPSLQTPPPPAKQSCSCTKRNNNKGNLAEASLTKDEELGLLESFRAEAVFFFLSLSVFWPLEAECVMTKECDDGEALQGFFCTGVPPLNCILLTLNVVQTDGQLAALELD